MSLTNYFCRDAAFGPEEIAVIDGDEKFYWQQFSERRLGSDHTPMSVDIWPELPRGPAGKGFKREVGDRFWRGRDSLVCQGQFAV